MPRIAPPSTTNAARALMAYDLSPSRALHKPAFLSQDKHSLSMQFRDLPPLHFLPAFEAAGRLGSFKAAAAELHVTPPAISQQLKAVEDALGVALFERRGRSVRLTPAGEAYLRDVQQLLSEAASATRRVRQRSSQRVLRVSMPDFVAYDFMLARLSQFRAAFPGIELSVEASPRIIDFA